MRIETDRLVLRPWREDDAAALFKYASDPQVGPPAGWLPHESEAYSLNILRELLIDDHTWAITIKPSDEPAGSIGISPGGLEAQNGELEIGYWIGRPFWGKGYVPEAVRAVLSLYFSLGAERIWCKHYRGNDKSRRVIEKCGFRFLFSAVERCSQLPEERETLCYAVTSEEFDD